MDLSSAWRGEGRRGFEKSVSRNFYCGRLKTILKEDIKFSCSLSLSLSTVTVWVRVYALCLHNTHKGAIELIHRTIPSTDAYNSFVIFVDYESIYEMMIYMEIIFEVMHFRGEMFI